jgi:NADH-quinone oxidoreductase subunit A
VPAICARDERIDSFGRRSRAQARPTCETRIWRDENTAAAEPCAGKRRALRARPSRFSQAVFPDGSSIKMASSVAAGYLPILLFLGVALGISLVFVVAPMLVSRLTGANNPYPDKVSEYECGFPAFEDSRAQFDVRFYLIAILFIIFDLEAAFLFPWAVSLAEIGWTGWFTMMIFLAELGLGFAYAWKKGALEWE